MNYWDELNNYDESSSITNNFVIPNGTIAKVRMTIKQGGYNDQANGWTDGYATKSIVSGSIYLDGEFIILEGQYNKRKVWSKIGLESPKGPNWGNMGKALIKSIINSAKGISPKDNSDDANNARKIKSFKELDEIEFVARIVITKDQDGNERNEIKMAITPDHNLYKSFMYSNSNQYEHKQSYTAPAPINSNHSHWS